MKDANKNRTQLISAILDLGKFKTICDRAGYGVVIRDLKGHFVYMNKCFAQMHGYTPKELQGKHYSIVHTPEQVEHVDSLENIRKEKGFYIAEIGHKRKDGKIFPTLMSGTILRDDSGNHLYNTATAIDITELKNVEEALRKQIRRNELILETAMDGFLLIDRKGEILEANNSASMIFGYPREKLIGVDINDFEADQRLKGNIKHFKKIVEQESHRFEVKYRAKNGRILDLEFSANFIGLDAESFFFCFFRDITEKKETNQALREKDRELKLNNRNLEEANAALRVVLKKRDSDKAELEEKVLYNFKELVAPILEKLKNSRLDKRQKTYLSILESNLNDIASPFARRLVHFFIKLTPTEIQIANFIREGKTNKNIAELMCLSVRTIEFHRKNIRKKLGITNKKTNLRSNLLSLQ